MSPLFRERDDFEATIDTAAADVLHVNAAIVEKDYWVTQTLRALAETFPEDFVFKGGTSLSKAFGLLNRFSEDIDLLLLPRERGRSALDRLMKDMGEKAAEAIGSGSPVYENQDKGVKRKVLLSYPRKRPVAWLGPTIDLEIGIRGGPHPWEVRSAGTLIGDALLSQGIQADEYDDLASFRVTVLHPGRTCVEKLALVNEQANACETNEDYEFPGRHGRHFYDIYMLLGDASVQEFLQDRRQFQEVVADCEQVSRKYFRSEYQRPEGGYAAGPAFSGEARVLDQAQRAYQDAVRDLTFGDDPTPSWEEVLARVQESSEFL